MSEPQKSELVPISSLESRFESCVDDFVKYRERADDAPTIDHIVVLEDIMIDFYMDDADKPFPKKADERLEEKKVAHATEFDSITHSFDSDRKRTEATETLLQKLGEESAIETLKDIAATIRKRSLVYR